MSRSLNCSTRPIAHLSGSDPVKLKHWAGTKEHLKKFVEFSKRQGESSMDWVGVTAGAHLGEVVNQKINSPLYVIL